MASYLLAWNPKRWHWADFEETRQKVQAGAFVERRWTCGAKRVRIGDRVFLIRLGVEPKGIVASGVAISEPTISEHWNGSGRPRRFLITQLDTLLDAESEPILPIERLNSDPALASMRWSARQSGVRIPDDMAAALERAWGPFTQRE